VETLILARDLGSWDPVLAASLGAGRMPELTQGTPAASGQYEGPYMGLHPGGVRAVQIRYEGAIRALSGWYRGRCVPSHVGVVWC